MIKKLRLKFVAIFMAMNTVFAAVLLVSALLSARGNLERLSRSVLRRVLDEPPGSSVDVGGDGVALPYFTVELLGGVPYMAGGTYPGLENTETLDDIVYDCLSQESPEGVLPAYGLRYMRRGGDWRIRLAFVDMSMERAALRNLFASWLLIALLAIPPLLGLAVLLSRWASAPAERAWRQQRQFLSDASHELKTPLTVILSNADLLEAADLDDRPRRWAENIRTEARRMRALVEEMLTLARADSAAGGSVQGEVSLSDAAADCALSFEPVAFEAGKPLRYEIAPGVTVTGDGEKLRRLLSILLDNAVKYGAPGGTITLALEQAGKEARLTVSNPGEPIPAADLSRLFERFYRVDASRGNPSRGDTSRTEQSGFGLGLSIAAAIAREHRGTLRAESDEVSTRFLFTLPLLPPGRRGGPPEGTKEPEAQNERTQKREEET